MIKRKELSGEKKSNWKLFFSPSMVLCSVSGLLLCSYCKTVPILLWQLWNRFAQMQIWCNTGWPGSLIIQFWVQLHGLKAIQYTCSHWVSWNYGLAEERKQSAQRQRLLFNQSTKSFRHVTETSSGLKLIARNQRDMKFKRLTVFFLAGGWLVDGH